MIEYDQFLGLPVELFSPLVELLHVFYEELVVECLPRVLAAVENFFVRLGEFLFVVHRIPCHIAEEHRQRVSLYAIQPFDVLHQIAPDAKSLFFILHSSPDGFQGHIDVLNDGHSHEFAGFLFLALLKPIGSTESEDDGNGGGENGCQQFLGKASQLRVLPELGHAKFYVHLV